jgi:CBS domain containing-hemolysin-like protein
LVLIEEVNAFFNLTLQDPNYDTIAGFILGRQGCIGTVGDVIKVTNSGRKLSFRIEAMDGLRIALVRLETPEAASPTAEE